MLRFFTKRSFSSFDPSKNYYRVLKLSPKATPEEIKQNYLRLAKFYHPDRNSGFHAEKFKQVNEAY